MQDHEVYALVVKGTVDIQGLVALSRNNDFQAVYIAWMCVAPQNNKMLCDYPKYTGVGGHLFAIAADKSMGSGSAMAYISQDKIRNMLIPLPPIAEQKRIVEKIGVLLNVFV